MLPSCPRLVRSAAALALAALLAGAAAAPPRVALRFEAPYPASLYWYLNALAGDSHVNVAAYRTHWREVAGGKPGDQAAIDAFREVRDRYRGAFPDDPARENAWQPAPPGSGNEVHNRFANAFLASATMDQAWLKAEGLLAPADFRALRAAVRVVEPRIAAQWRTWDYLHAYDRAFTAYAREKDLDGLLGQVARYLEVPGGGTIDAPVTFVFTPPARDTHGRKVGGNLIVEVVPGERPVERVDVVVHELSHLLYDEAGLNDDPALIDAWYQAGGAAIASPALALLNEGVATAIGQGVTLAAHDPAAFRRTRVAPGGWYNDDRIDPYAKAIYEDVAAGVAGGATIKARAAAFVAAYQRAFGAPAGAPRDWLASYFLSLPNRRDAAFKPYFDAMPPRSIFGLSIAASAGEWRRFPGMAAVIGVTAAEWPALREAAGGWGLDEAELAHLTSGAPGLHVEARAGGAPLYVVSAASKPELGLALARFAKLPTAAPGYTSLAP